VSPTNNVAWTEAYLCTKWHPNPIIDPAVWPWQ